MLYVSFVTCVYVCPTELNDVIPAWECVLPCFPKGCFKDYQTFLDWVQADPVKNAYIAKDSWNNVYPFAQTINNDYKYVYMTWHDTLSQHQDMIFTIHLIYIVFCFCSNWSEDDAWNSLLDEFAQAQLKK